MKVVVSAIGRSHLFDLARQLIRHDALAGLLTAYPIFKVDPDLRPYAQTFPLAAAAERIAIRLKPGDLRDWVYWNIIEQYDRWAARRLPDGDLVIAGSGRGLHTIRTAKRRGMRTVCDRGSTHIQTQEALLKAEYLRWNVPFHDFDRRGMRKEISEYAEADLVVVPSEFARRSFLENGCAPDKVARLPYGVELSQFRQFPKTDRVFRVVFCGTLSLQKGIPDLLEALAGLEEADMEAWAIGGVQSEVKPFLKNIPGRLRLLGFIPRLQLARYLSQGSVLVMPSIQEGLALVQAQAMACGLPVIASTNTGAEDLFQDGVEGFIIPPRDSASLRERIDQLHRDPALQQKMSQAALRRVKELGGWDRYGDMAVETYQRLLTA